MLAGCAGAALAALAYPGGRSPAEAMLDAALTVFLSWAMIRELDPDHPVSALVGAGVAAAVSIVAGSTSAVALAALMLTARIVVRSTGLRPLVSDIAVVGVFVGALARTPLVWAMGLALALAVAVDTGLPEPAPQRNVWLAGAIGLAVTLTAVISDALRVSWSLPGTTTVGLAVAGLALMVLAPADRVRSVCDHRPTALHPERLRTARLIAAGALTVGTVVGGAAHAAMSWPGWVGIIAAGVGARWGP